MTGIDLSKQEAVDGDPKTIEQIIFTGDVERDNGVVMFSIGQEAKETILDFSQGTVKVL